MDLYASVVLSMVAIGLALVALVIVVAIVESGFGPLRIVESGVVWMELRTGWTSLLAAVLAVFIGLGMMIAGRISIAGGGATFGVLLLLCGLLAFAAGCSGLIQGWGRRFLFGQDGVIGQTATGARFLPWDHIAEIRQLGKTSKPGAAPKGFVFVARDGVAFTLKGEGLRGFNALIAAVMRRADRGEIRLTGGH